MRDPFGIALRSSLGRVHYGKMTNAKGLSAVSYFGPVLKISYEIQDDLETHFYPQLQIVQFIK